MCQNAAYQALSAGRAAEACQVHTERLGGIALTDGWSGYCPRGHQLPDETSSCPSCAVEDDQARIDAQASAAVVPPQYENQPQAAVNYSHDDSAEAPVSQAQFGHTQVPYQQQWLPEATGPYPVPSGGGSKLPIIIGVGALVAVVLVALAVFGLRGSSSDSGDSTTASGGSPSAAAGTSSRTASPSTTVAMRGSPRQFVNVALWPFDSPQAADQWVQQAGDSDAWRFDAGQTALRFVNEYLGFTEVNQIVGVDERGDHAWVKVGQSVGNSTHTAANIHLQRVGSAVVAPWVVVGTEDDSLTLDSPAYGSTVVGQTISAGGKITGVDECIGVRVLQQGRTLGEARCVMAGGSSSPWSNPVTISGVQPVPVTVVASTGGHYARVENFAITGLHAN